MNNRVKIVIIVISIVAATGAWYIFRGKDGAAPTTQSSDTSSQTTVSCGTFVEPVSGTTVDSGAPLSVQAIIIGQWDSVQLVAGGDVGFAPVNIRSGTATVTVPATAVGSFIINMVGTKGDKELCYGPSVILNARPSATITALYVLPTRITLPIGETKQVLVSADYSDGVARAAGSALVGTVFKSADPLIASVDELGVVTGRKIGITTINISNGTLYKNITAQITE